jgi:hypothetical protein
MIKTLAVTALLFTSLLAAARSTSEVPGPPVIHETERTIRNYFKFPQMLISQHGLRAAALNRVEVLFTTDRNGYVNFVMAKTENIRLKQEIEKQFVRLHLSRLKQDVVHSVVLNFRQL